MSAKEMAFNVFSMVSASKMFSADGSVAIVVVVNIDDIVDIVVECVGFFETASAALWPPDSTEGWSNALGFSLLVWVFLGW